MTIRITIENDESNGADRVVRVRPMTLSRTGERFPALASETTLSGNAKVECTAIVLRPGEKTEAWLHSGQMVEVFEGDPT